MDNWKLFLPKLCGYRELSNEVSRDLYLQIKIVLNQPLPQSAILECSTKWKIISSSSSWTKRRSSNSWFWTSIKLRVVVNGWSASPYVKLNPRPQIDQFPYILVIYSETVGFTEFLTVMLINSWRLTESGAVGFVLNQPGARPGVRGAIAASVCLRAYK